MNSMAQRAKRLSATTVGKSRRMESETSYFYVRNGSGVFISEQTAMQYTALWRAVNIIANAMAFMGVGVFQRVGDKRLEVANSMIKFVLAGQANNELAGFRLRQAMAAHVLTWGNGYGEIEWIDADLAAIHLLNPSRMKVCRDPETGRLEYHYNDTMGGLKVLPAWKVFHFAGLGFDGLVGYSPIQLFKNALGMGVAMERYGANYFGNGGAPIGVLQSDKEVTAETVQRLRKEWTEMYGGPDNAGKPAILEDGLKWANISLPNDVAQFIETRTFQVDEVARIYGLPPHMLGSMGSSTNNNIEHMGIDLVTHGLLPWVTAFEAEGNIKLLGRDKMLEGFYMKLNVNTLLRGDSTQRGTLYKTMTDIGAWSPNDVLALEDMNPVEGGDLRTVMMNRVPLTKAMDLLGKVNGRIPASPDRGGSPDVTDPSNAGVMTNGPQA